MAAPTRTTTIQDTWAHQLTVTHATLQMNLAGVDHETALRAPERGGNSINWILGHMICVRGALLRMLGAEPVMGPDADRIYKRGSRALGPDDACEPLEELRRLLDASQQRILERLAAGAPEDLERAPSGSGASTEPLWQQVSLLVFHDAYHAGQIGVIRRAVGMPGAIA